MFLSIFFLPGAVSRVVGSWAAFKSAAPDSPLILNVQPWYIVIFMTICLSLYIKVTDTNRLAQFQCLHVCCWLCCPSVVTLWVTQYAQSMSISGSSPMVCLSTLLYVTHFGTHHRLGGDPRRLHIGIWVNRCVCCSTGWKTSFLYKT